MAQHRTLLAFRKRCKKRGYRDIHIKQHPTDKERYIVEAREPLAGQIVKAVYSLEAFGYLMH
jgi:hypothetical protein